MEQSAKEGLHSALKAHKDFGLPGRFHRNGVIARNVLHEDLGYYSDQDTKMSAANATTRVRSRT
jgi:hypothetical protein